MLMCLLTSEALVDAAPDADVLADSDKSPPPSS